MSNAITRVSEHAIAIGEQYGFDRSKTELIKSLVADGATDNELALFLYTAQRTGLDPLARQIYCIKRQGKMTIQAGIDGYRLIADRTGKYAGNDDPVFGPDHQVGNTTAPTSATVTVWKMVSGVRCPFTSTARWSEYCPAGNQAFMWTKMPYLMLGKCAEALALRKAFPAELSGIYTDAEMDQAGQTSPIVEQTPVKTINQAMHKKADVTPSEAAEKFWQHFESVLGSREWSTVQTLLGAKVGVPDSVPGWRECWKAVDAALAVEAEQA
jgi:phage recombination protein Bet